MGVSELREIVEEESQGTKNIVNRRIIDVYMGL